MLNPEFRRNIWHELTLHRSIAMPLILCILYAFIYLLFANSSYGTISSVVVIVFVFLTFIWGVKLASESVLAEVKDNTWDFQRMSALSPWSMTWGKLFGSTIFVWYGAGMSIVVFVVFSPQNDIISVLKTAAFLVISGLMGQSVSFLLGLQLLKRERKISRGSSVGNLMIGIIAAFVSLSLNDGEGESVEWYSQIYSRSDFFLAVVFLFYLWSLLGSYRLMKTELQRRSFVPVYPFFLIFGIIFLAGFRFEEVNTFDRIIMASFAIPVIFNYILIVLDDKNPVQVRRVLTEYAIKNHKNIPDILPAWIFSFPIIIPAFFAGFFIFPSGINLPSANGFTWIAFLISIVFFHVRDIAIILFFNFSKNPSRADAASIAYLGILYVIVPGVLHLMDMPSLTSPFWPLPDNHGIPGIVFAPAEAAVMLLLLYRRWRSLEVMGEINITVDKKQGGSDIADY